MHLTQFFSHISHVLFGIFQSIHQHIYILSGYANPRSCTRLVAIRIIFSRVLGVKSYVSTICLIKSISTIHIEIRNLDLKIYSCMKEKIEVRLCSRILPFKASILMFKVLNASVTKVMFHILPSSDRFWSIAIVFMLLSFGKFFC